MTDRPPLTPDQIEEARAMIDEAVLMSEQALDTYRALAFVAGRLRELPGLEDAAPFFALAAGLALSCAEKAVRAGEVLNSSLHRSVDGNPAGNGGNALVPAGEPLRVAA